MFDIFDEDYIYQSTLRHERNEGRREGEEKGRREGRNEIIDKFLKSGMSRDQINAILMS